jgi:hypothetical protein
MLSRSPEDGSVRVSTPLQDAENWRSRASLPQ